MYSIYKSGGYPYKSGEYPNKYRPILIYPILSKILSKRDQELFVYNFKIELKENHRFTPT